MRRDPLLQRLACGLLLGGGFLPSQREEAPRRGHDPWVFRSVLDRRPRMLTLALHDDLWVAYDTSECSFYKAWKGGVKFEGAVYTKEHGPQPTSVGEAYCAGPPGSAWTQTRGGRPSPVRLVYGGHLFRDGGVRLKYSCSLDDGTRVEIEESPEFVREEGERAGPTRIGFRRRFVARGLPGGVTLFAAIRAACEGWRAGLPSGPVAEEWARRAGGLLQLEARLPLDAARPSNEITLFFAPKKAREEAAEVAIPPREPLPSPSPPEEKANTENPAAAAPAPARGAFERGLALRVYKADRPLSRVPRLVAGQTPNLSRVVPTLDLDEERGDFGDLESDYLTEITGELLAPVAGKYGLRLTSDDGSILTIDDRDVIRHDGLRDFDSAEAETDLSSGPHWIRLRHFERGGEAALRLEWRPPGAEDFTLLPSEALRTEAGEVRVTSPGPKKVESVLSRGAPGWGRPLEEVHPSYTVSTVRPEGFEPRVGGLDWLPGGRMVLCTWDAEGAVYLLDGTAGEDRSRITAKKIASGLAEPLGLRVVDGRIFVLQKQELTELVDHDGDDVADEYRCVCGSWPVSANFHEFAFGLAHENGRLYANLAIAINPGGRSTKPQVPGRGSVIRISPEDGSYEIVAQGLRAPNGIGRGPGGGIYVTDNQGDWLPVSKLMRVKEGAFYGSRAVLGDAAADLEVTPPVVWLPQGEIGNSPSEPAEIPPGHGSYSRQMVVGDVTHGGLKRVFLETVDGIEQGCVFRFTQGLEAGVNRVRVGPDGALYVGGIGSTGNWGQEGKAWFGLQRLRYTGAPAFEMLAVRALSDGLELEFTEPLAERSGWEPDAYRVRQWWYEPTENYGGPKKDVETLPVLVASVSPDRRRVFLRIDGLEESHVVHVDLVGAIEAESGRTLWSPEAWATLNRIPAGRPGTVWPAPILPPPNTLTEEERAAGWRLLFDGKSGAGWRGFRGDSLPEGWKVVDGSLARVGPAGDIVTEEEFEDFELSLDWKISPGGNSGIFFRVTEDEDTVWKTGPEMQVLDNEGHADGASAKTSAGANYALHAPRFDVTRPVGLFNQARIRVEGSRVEYRLNGSPLLEYELGSPEWRSLVAESKFASMPQHGTKRRGRIALQDHGDPVFYRNIKIRPPSSR